MASERKALIVESKDLVVRDACTPNPCLVQNADGMPIAQQFDIETDSERYPQLTLPLLGYHQFINATTAVAAIECLKQRGYIVPKDSVYAGFKNVQWHGRIQHIKSSPIVVLDGAHSPASMEALCCTLRQSYRYNRVTFIVGLMRDKNLTAVGRVISQIADSVITTQVPNNPRVTPAEEIQRAWQRMCDKITACSTPEKAIAKALSEALPTDLICVTGSLYLVGQALEIFKSNFFSERLHWNSSFLAKDRKPVMKWRAPLRKGPSMLNPISSNRKEN